VEAALLELGADRLEVLRRAREVVAALRALVELERAAEVLPRARIGPGHLHVDVDRADVVAQRDEVVARSRAQVLDLLGLQPPRPAAAQQARDPEAARQEREQRQQPAPAVARRRAAPSSRAPAGPLPPRCRAAPTRRTKSLSTASAPSLPRALADWAARRWTPPTWLETATSPFLGQDRVGARQAQRRQQHPPRGLRGAARGVQLLAAQRRDVDGPAPLRAMTARTRSAAAASSGPSGSA
jgi:hypothetical protein